jgi:hypothetical protein
METKNDAPAKLIDDDEDRSNELIEIVTTHAPGTPYTFLSDVDNLNRLNELIYLAKHVFPAGSDYLIEWLAVIQVISENEDEKMMKQNFKKNLQKN